MFNVVWVGGGWVKEMQAIAVRFIIYVAVDKDPWPILNF